MRFNVAKCRYECECGYTTCSDKDINTHLDSHAVEECIKAEQMEVPKDKIKKFDTINKAYKHAKSNAIIGDRILTFGSFLTVQSLLVLTEFN